MESFSNTVLMVRPKSFGPNPQTKESNAFQQDADGVTLKEIQAKAIEEFDSLKSLLTEHDIEVIEYSDTKSPVKKDAIFPNNWFTTHAKSSIVSYPMFAENRRAERREDIIEELQEKFQYKKRYAFEYHEETNEFLEGTGSMIIDRDSRIVYASLSTRTNIVVLEKFAVLLGYRKIIFHGTDRHNIPIYHTNVMMAQGNQFVVICLECIKDQDEKKEVIRSLNANGKTIIDISYVQMESFAGNMIQLKSKLGEYYLLMSECAYNSLHINQIDQILSSSKILKASIPTIEKYGGGSVRCMLAELF